MIYLTSDWHLDDPYAPGSHIYLRPKPTDQLKEEWLAECHRLIQPDDDLYLLGDMVSHSCSLEFLDELPDCRIHYMPGNREMKIPHFTEQVFLHAKKRRNRLEIFGEHDHSVEFIEIPNFGTWRASHRPAELIGFSLSMPAFCGHVHGVWRTQIINFDSPLINVGIDAWGRLVSEELIAHEYRAVKEGYYTSIIF